MNRRSFLGRVAAAISAPFVGRMVPPPADIYSFEGSRTVFDPDVPLYVKRVTPCVFGALRGRALAWGDDSPAACSY